MPRADNNTQFLEWYRKIAKSLHAWHLSTSNSGSHSALVYWYSEGTVTVHNFIVYSQFSEWEVKRVLAQAQRFFLVSYRLK